jgi:transglutaminase/protease-like cytokinesis protein 3
MTTKRKHFIFILFIFNLLPVYSLAQNFVLVDSIVSNYPASFREPEQLAQFINSNFTDPSEKARAAYAWIAHNIAYDVEALQNGTPDYQYTYNSKAEKEAKELAIRKKIASETLRKRKGVCENYANLFNETCHLLGLESVTIHGCSKTTERQIGVIPKGSDHAWNAVKINGTWQLVDVTWGAGNRVNNVFEAHYSDVYFFTNPKLFVLNHFPADSIWLLTPCSAEDFAHFPLVYRTFFETGINFEQPAGGIIKVKQNELIHFQYTSPSEISDLSYAFSNEKSGTTIQPEENGSTYSFNVTYKSYAAKYLTIYYRSKAMISFKLEQ